MEQLAVCHLMQQKVSRLLLCVPEFLQRWKLSFTPKQPQTKQISKQNNTEEKPLSELCALLSRALRGNGLPRRQVSVWLLGLA